MKEKQDFTPYSLNVGGRLVNVDSPVVMGILNVTPDSFYAGSRKQTEADIALRAEQIVAEGGTFIDVGGYSTRPGAADVSEEEELERLRRGLAVVRRTVPEAILSVDTFRAGVARRLLDEFGPFIVNDVTAASDSDMLPLVEHCRVPYVYTFTVPLTEVGTALRQTTSPDGDPIGERLTRLPDLIVDPGFGFGKTLEENYECLRNLAFFHHMEAPLLVGVSRKSMVYRLLDCSPEEALNGTTVLHAVALQQGAHILRVHDVKAAADTIKIIRKCSCL